MNKTIFNYGNFLFSLAVLFLFLQNINGQQSDLEQAQAMKFVASFTQTYEKLKDFKKLPDSFFAADFKNRLAADDQWQFQESEFSSQFSEKEQFENISLTFDLSYLLIMYNIGAGKFGRNLDENLIFPPQLLRSVKANKLFYKFIKDNMIKLESFIQLRQMYNEIKNITIFLRRYLNTRSPKWKAVYLKNIHEMRQEIKSYETYLCEGEDCKTLPEKTQIFSINFFPLSFKLYKENNQFKVIHIYLFHGD